MSKFIELELKSKTHRLTLSVNVEQIRYLRPQTTGGTQVVFDENQSVIVEEDSGALSCSLDSRASSICFIPLRDYGAVTRPPKLEAARAGCSMTSAQLFHRTGGTSLLKRRSKIPDHQPEQPTASDHREK